MSNENNKERKNYYEDRMLMKEGKAENEWRGVL
jgi:hypothetical protein